jgi:transposase
MRKQFDTLAALVKNQFQLSLLDGGLFLFVGRTQKRAKVLFWDGTGLCLYSKRLSQGRFLAPWKHTKPGPWKLSPSELQLFLEGCSHVGRLELSPPPWTPRAIAS